MSYGGHGTEPSGNEYSPTFRELSEIRAWDGPSAAVQSLDAMMAMMYPIDDILQSRPRPEDISEERHEGAIRNALSFLNTIHACIDALLKPVPYSRPLSFAEVVYLAGSHVREHFFDPALAEEKIDQYEYDELMEDLLRAAAEICSAYDLAVLKQSLPQQRTASSLKLGRFTLPAPTI